MKGVSDEATALVWRVAQEALRNATRHARATSVDISVTRSHGQVVLDVEDDGVGFDPDAVAPRGHLGLRGLRDLAVEAGGRLTVTSAPGQGTHVHVEVGDR